MTRSRKRKLQRETGRPSALRALAAGVPTLLAGMFAAGQVDEAWTFIAPRILGGSGGNAPPLPGRLVTLSGLRP